MRREHDSLYLGLAPVTTFSFPQLSIPHCFTYSAAHGNSNSVCLALGRRAVAMVLSDCLFRADATPPLLAGTGFEFAISHESCGCRKDRRPRRTNCMGVLGSG